MTPERLEIWLIDFGIGEHSSRKIGLRPAIVLSTLEFNSHADTVTVVPLKTYKGGVIHSNDVKVDGGGLKHPSIVSYSNLQAIPNTRGYLIRRVGVVLEQYRDLVDLALMRHLGLGDRVFWQKEAVVSRARH